MIEGLIGVAVGVVVGFFLAVVYNNAFDKPLSKRTCNISLSTSHCKDIVRLKLDNEYFYLNKMLAKGLRKLLKKHIKELE
jgi:hypothetical protein